MAILIINKDLEEAERGLRELLKEAPRPLMIWQAAQFSADAFFQEVAHYPLFSQKRSLVIQAIERLSASDGEKLYQYVCQPSPWIHLYLTSSGAAHPSLVKELRIQGKVIESPEEKPWEKEKRLIQWVLQQTKQEAIACSLQVATQMVKATPPEMLHLEWEKLLCYLGRRRTLTFGDLEAILTWNPQETLWQLGEAILARTPQRAWGIAERFLKEGDLSAIGLITHLRLQFSQALDLLLAAETQSVKKQFPYLTSKQLEKKLPILTRYGKNALKAGTLLLFEAEMKAKNNILNDILLCELVILKLLVKNDPLSST